MKIGFIGLGRMGFSLASSLLKQQQKVLAFDLNSEAMAKLKEKGAFASADITAVAKEADIVFTMLPGPKEVLAVLTGADGVFNNLKQGSICLDLSTVDTQTVDQLSEVATKRGIIFGDAPVGRLAAHADRGESLFMLGIAPEYVKTVEPILLKMGTTVTYCGPAGCGTRTKLINNLMVLSYCQINSEALVLAKSLGLEVDLIYNVLTGTTASNGQLKEKWPNKVLKGDLSPGFDLTLGHKDLSLVCKAAELNNIKLPIGNIAKDIFEKAIAAGYSGKDTSSLTDYWSSINNISNIRF